jgi:hypothetical protein
LPVIPPDLEKKTANFGGRGLPGWITNCSKRGDSRSSPTHIAHVNSSCNTAATLLFFDPPANIAMGEGEVVRVRNAVGALVLSSDPTE